MRSAGRAHAASRAAPCRGSSGTCSRCAARCPGAGSGFESWRLLVTSTDALAARSGALREPAPCCAPLSPSLALAITTMTDPSHRALPTPRQAMRAVNQAMGRVIRHRWDYGAVILADK